MYFRSSLLTIPKFGKASSNFYAARLYQEHFFGNYFQQQIFFFFLIHVHGPFPFIIQTLHLSILLWSCND